MSFLAPILVLAVTLPLLVALLRANELFCLRLRRGQLRVARGRIPGQLLDDIGVVLRDPPTDHGTVRGVVEDRRLRIRASVALTDGQEQRLRNIASAWPVVRIRSAPRSRRR